MGILEQDAVKTSFISFLGIGLGYVNKAVLFVLLFTTAQVGLINLLFSVSVLFAQFANLGTTFSTWRFFPFFRNKQNGHFGFLLLNFLVVCLGILLFSLLLWCLEPAIVTRYEEKSALFVSYLYWIIPFGTALVFFLLFENYLRGMRQNVLPAILQEVVLRVLVSVLLLFYYFEFIDFFAFVLWYVCIHFVPVIYLLLFLIKRGELHFDVKKIAISRRFRKIMLAYSAFSYINGLALLFVLSMDALMVAQYIGISATGVYTTIVFLISGLIFPYRALTKVSSPLVALYWKQKNLVAMNQLYKQTSAVSFLVGLFGFLAFWSVIDEVFTFIPDYSSGKWVFFFLMLGRIVDMYFGLNTTILSTSKKYKVDLFFTLFLVFGVYLLNVLLIPIYGIVGAAISTSISLVVVNLARGFYLWKVYRLSPLEKQQFLLLLLGFFVFVLQELLFSYLFPLDIQPLLAICVKSLFVVVLLGAPLYFWNLEPTIVNYINKLLAKMRSS
jgi:O-antigen/teichoic acid export membrane protein